MYKLYRYFYHKLCCYQTMHYYMDELSFNTLVELNDFVYSTYRNKYTITKSGMDFILYSNDRVTEIHCVVSKEN